MASITAVARLVHINPSSKLNPSLISATKPLFPFLSLKSSYSPIVSSSAASLTSSRAMSYDKQLIAAKKAASLASLLCQASFSIYLSYLIARKPVEMIVSELVCSNWWLLFVIESYPEKILCFLMELLWVFYQSVHIVGFECCRCITDLWWLIWWFNRTQKRN